MYAPDHVYTGDAPEEYLHLYRVTAEDLHDDPNMDLMELKYSHNQQPACITDMGGPFVPDRWPVDMEWSGMN